MYNDLFIKRNLAKYVLNKVYGVYKLFYRKNKPLTYFYTTCNVLINFYFFKRIFIPQVEFILTTNCTLKCKNCSNYIPYIKKDKNFVLNFLDFKKYLNNLLKNVHRLNSLIIVGGEPLLNPDFDEILKYALSTKKVEKVYIYTNGTILFSDKQLFLLKKNKSKVCVFLSNYTANKELKNILKIDGIIEQLKRNKIQYVFNEKMVWIKQEEIISYDRTEDLNKNICKKCGVPSVSIVKNKMHYCPKAATAEINNIINYKETDYIDLNNVVTKNEILNFYSKDNFSVCGYCSGPDSIKYLIKPAEQLKDI